MKTEYDFSQCLYDPTDKQLAKKIEKLEEFKEPLGAMERHRMNIYRFIIIMYDMKSPFRMLYPSINERRREAAREGGFQLNRNGVFPADIEDVILGVNEVVAKMVAGYIMQFGIPELVALEGCMSQFLEESEKLIRRKGDMNTYKLQKALMEDIKEYELNIFGGQEILEMRKALYQSLESKRRAPKPEEVAKRLQENPNDKLDDFCPYGDYNVDKLKFIGDGDV